VLLPNRSSNQDRLIQRSTWVVLHGKWGKPAAIDLESKCVEAALVNIQLADYRNFAHGRHNWVAKHLETTGVVALVGPEEVEIARRTLELLPDSVPALTLDTDQDGPAGSLDLLIQAMALVGTMGAARGIDPGKPKVASFGRQLYRLRTPNRANSNRDMPHIGRVAATAIMRKTKCNSLASLSSDELHIWLQAHSAFRRRLQRTKFSAIVFDYDNTLCAQTVRSSAPSR